MTPCARPATAPSRRAGLAAAALLAVLTMLLATGCGAEPGGPGGPGGPADGTPGPTATAPPTLPTDLEPTQPGPIQPVQPSPPLAVDAALTGEVTAGVESGCKLLATEAGDYLLFGPLAEELRYGETVTVRGQVRDDVASYCQQGTPFEVTEIVR